MDIEILRRIFHDDGPCSRDMEEVAGDPRFDKADPSHGCQDWRNHVPDSVKECWSDLSLEAKVIAMVIAEEAAGQEDWGLSR